MRLFFAALVMGSSLLLPTEALAGKPKPKPKPPQAVVVTLKGALFDEQTGSRIGGDYVRIPSVRQKTQVGWFGNYGINFKIKSAITYQVCADAYGYFENCQEVTLSPQQKVMVLDFEMVKNPNVKIPATIIVSDQGDCQYGFISDYITVEVGQQIFEFDASCDFFSEGTFQTADGTGCQWQSGMCSPFLPLAEVTVSCQDGSYSSHYIACP